VDFLNHNRSSFRENYCLGSVALRSWGFGARRFNVVRELSGVETKIARIWHCLPWKSKENSPSEGGECDVVNYRMVVKINQPVLLSGNRVVGPQVIELDADSDDYSSVVHSRFLNPKVSAKFKDSPLKYANGVWSFA